MPHYNNPYDAAISNTPEGLDYFWSHLPGDYWSDSRLQFCQTVAGQIRPYLAEPETLLVEVGCGDGHVLRAVYDTYPDIKIDSVGIDYARSAITAACRLVPEGTFFAWDITKNGFLGGHDLVLCIETLEHITAVDAAIKNMLSLLRTGGHLFITVPDGEHDTYKGHVNKFTAASLYEVLLPYQEKGALLETGELVAGHYLYGVLQKGNQ